MVISRKLFIFSSNAAVFTEFPQCVASSGEDGAAPPDFISDCTEAALGAGLQEPNHKTLESRHLQSVISIKSCGFFLNDFLELFLSETIAETHHDAILDASLCPSLLNL